MIDILNMNNDKYKTITTTVDDKTLLHKLSLIDKVNKFMRIERVLHRFN